MRPEEISPRIVVILLGIIVLFVGFYLSLMRIDTFLRNSAIDECAAQSKYEKNDKASSAVISYPIQDVYENCLKRKGI